MSGVIEDKCAMIDSLYLNGVTDDKVTIDVSKLDDLRKVIHDLVRASETITTQNAFLAQRVNELENNEITKLRVEVESKATHLKLADLKIAELKKREFDNRPQLLSCMRCEKNERQVVTLPCAHVCLCKLCTKLTYNCFICGRHQESTLEVSLR